MPELIEDGLTGFLVLDLDAAVAAMRRVPDLDRAEIRARAVERFSADRMVDEYLSLYERILGRSGR
jgi:glycosyltransferase involved in cell wall biosynthesis